MNTLTLMLVALAMTARSAAAQSPASGAPPTELRQAQIELRRLSTQQRLTEVTQRLNLLVRQAVVAHVEQVTGAKLDAASIERAKDGVVHASGNVTLTFQGGVIIAGEVTIENDGTVRILGDSQVKLTAK